MYSQQEYETVRRQTMQIEAEKRALLRFMVMVLSILLIGALLAAGMFYGMYQRNINIADSAASRIEALQKQLDESTRALREKTAELEKITNAARQQQQQLEGMIPKILSKAASTAEIGEFAHNVYESPGRRVEVPRPPPNDLFTRFYRYRTADGKTQKFVLVAGELDGRKVIYSNLVSDNAPL
ncbi:MAG TPA: hypothetical protein VFD58_12385 [Blastocatellia bacterium]|nr:hypothetical protein [Blastocatellia bacterium]